MASYYQSERERGAKEFQQQIAVLRARWPLAFPASRPDVRPLAIGAAHEIAATMGWSIPYAIGVLGVWKGGPVYCRAVLAHAHRIALDGSPAETVDAEAKDLATKRLAHLAARKSAKNAAPAAVHSEPAPAPPAPPDLRARVRASLLLRSV